ncbi:hypothetical protein EYB26_003501 [Talaromyces marneffei]|uniref:uncharacterized protein n=1 Tax=Talaromyces marneffei TaxID=37727 RepID=UPI0012AA3697|nr:uncharacterized protein EYB26_003501 [Talaromyces marneffei]QGA15840.1 hypothetical protein EYB26_003501 [Talaromyces marneffei]
MASPSTITTSATSAVPALTTTFTPAASCLTDLYLNNIVSNGFIWDYRQLGPAPTGTDCYPPKFAATPSAYFSPGICPTSYTIACSTVLSIGSSTETRATCCPSCQADKTAWPWYSTDLCTYEGSTTGTYLFTAQTSISTAIGLANLNAYGMEIRWQASDTSTPGATSALTTASSALSTSASASPASTALSTTPTPTSTPTSPSTSSLSTGAKAGIGIGAAVSALLILAGIIFFIIRRRRNSAAANKQENMDMHLTPAQLQQQEYYVEAAAGDVRSKPPYHELPTQPKERNPVELSSESWR